MLDPKEQSFDDGQSQRQLQPEGSAVAWPRLDMHRTLQALQNTLHHVQTNASSGKLRDLIRGAEAWPEDEIKNIGFTQPFGLFGGQ